MESLGSSSFSDSSIAYIAAPSLSAKQSQLLETFRGLIKQYDISLVINDEYCDRANQLVSLDIEHDEQGNLVGIGLYDGVTAFYFTYITPEIKAAIEGRDIIAHNGVSDFECLRQWGIQVRDEQLAHDTMLVGHIIDSSLKSYGLKDMAKRELGIIYPSYDDIVGKHTKKQSIERITLDKQPIELVAMYNAIDCFVTYKLYEKQYVCLLSVSQYFIELEKSCANTFADMSTRGLCVDLDYLSDLKETLEAQQAPIKAEILNELGNINLNSPKQLLEALHAKEIFPTLKGKPSTDKRALACHSHSGVVSQLLKFGELETLLASFVRPYIERNQDVVHPFFNQCGTRTGRPSCSNPNLLQIPRRTENGKLVRRMFVPRSGFQLGDCDYGQIEPRVLAHLSDDPALCEMFNANVDFHQFTADKLGISRDRAKILNLSVGYRATFKSVAAQLGCSDQEAQREIDKWWALFPALRRWQDRLIYDSRHSGFCTTLLGRRIKVDNLESRNQWQREAAERQLINNITQGSAAEIIKKAMIKVSTDSRLSPTFGLLVQVYDELLWESEDALRDGVIVIDNMVNALKLKVPLTVDCKIGNNWAECH